MIRYRTPENIKKKIDMLIRDHKKISIDHGIACYEYDHYEYIEGSYKNNFTPQLDVYVKDFWNNGNVILYMTLTADNMRKPTKNDWFTELVSCTWEKEFPTILNIKEYTVR